MDSLRVVLAAAFLASAFAFADQAALREHPIAGVLTLLGELQEQAREEGKVEQENYNQYAAWCRESKDTLKSAIAGEKAEISKLESKISSLKDEIGALGQDISYLEKQIEEQNSAQAAAQKIRDDENDLYTEEQDNIDSTIDAVQTATDAMEDTKLLQVADKEKIRNAALLMEYKLSPEQHKKVQMFLHSPSFLQAPDNKVPAEDYSFKSGDIIATFKGMVEDFEAEKEESKNEETNKKNNFNLAKKAREDAIKAAEDSKSEKEGIKSDKEGDKGDAENSKKEEEEALAADTALLENTEKDCAQTDREWEERSTIRSNEIEAMEMAKKILSKVTKVRNPDEHEIAKKEDLLSVKQASFVQTGMFLSVHRHVSAGDMKTKAVQGLLAAANKTHAVHSKALNQLASQLMTYDGPFDKLKSMIQKMIFRLMAEQKDEDDHKNWCDLETETNTENKEDKDAKISDFTKKLEDMDATVKNLILKIQENDEELEDLRLHVKQETKLREDNHKSILITIKDSKDAQVALNNAIGVLTAFYKESGMITKEPWEFVQVNSHKVATKVMHTAHGVELPDSPSTWDSSYTGTTDPKGSGDDAVLTLLNGVLDKFAQMEADATVQDTTDQENFERDMQATKVTIAETETDTSMKKQKQAGLEEKIDGMTAAKKHSARELSAIEAYLKDLEPACGEGDSSYEDRKQARKDEIEALRKAQNIFEDAFRAKEE